MYIYNMVDVDVRMWKKHPQYILYIVSILFVKLYKLQSMGNQIAKWQLYSNLSMTAVAPMSSWWSLAAIVYL